MGKLKQEGLKQSSDFFAKLKENKAVVELPSGLRYEVVKQGDGAAPKPTETVKVHYTGTLIDGTVFDSSVQRNEPAEFQLDQVIPGWTEGLQKVNKGGKIKLYVPPSLAYGDDARGNIPPSSTLIFEIDLLDIKPGAPAPAMPVAPAAGKYRLRLGELGQQGVPASHLGFIVGESRAGDRGTEPSVAQVIGRRF
ncbi:MAG: FKBP-type peptidyl-prolyl cis-trans isomerase [Verrucomicrobia bacterium]|nr:FKBP-type peptidyl-prolyl cis-trans isomerase [Verrucomicrobiota bacterium]